MKKLVLLIFVSLTFNVQAQVSFNWAKHASANGIVDSYGTVTDASGNVYYAGSFTQTTDFDPSSAVLNLTPPLAGFADVFIVKFTPSGDLIWAKQLGGNNDDNLTALAIDANNNLILAGYFFGTSDFNPGAGSNTLTSAGATDIFVCKLDSSGAYVWARRMGTVSDDQAYNVAVDNAGNVITIGTFYNTVDFNPGAGVNNFTSFGDMDIFINKLDANGNYLWNVAYGSSLMDAGYGITTDASNNVYVVGGFNGTIDFDPGAGTTSLSTGGAMNSFLVKLTSAGALSFARAVVGFDAGQGNTVQVDASGNIIIGGQFVGTADFDLGAGLNYLNAVGSADQYLLKVTPAGNTDFVKVIGGPVFDRINSVIVDNTNNIYTAGSFSGTLDFDPNAGVTNLVSAGSTDCYIAKYSNLGNLTWAIRMGGTSADVVRSVKVESNNAIYVSGRFAGTADFDPTAATFSLSTAVSGTPGAYLVKLFQGFPTPVSYLYFKGERLANATNQLEWQTSNEHNNDRFEVERSVDGIRFEYCGQVKGAGNSSTPLKYTFVDSKPYAGITYYRLKQVDIDEKFEYSSVISIEENGVATPVWQLYPNPTQGELHVNYFTPKNTQVNFELYNVNGQLVWNETKKMEAGNHKLDLDLNNLPQGNYLLKGLDKNSNKTLLQRLTKY